LLFKYLTNEKLILLSALFIFAFSSDDSNNNDNNSNNDDRELYSIITINNVATPAEFRYDFAGNTTMLYIPQEENQTTGSTSYQTETTFFTALATGLYGVNIYINGSLPGEFGLDGSPSINCANVIIETFLDEELKDTRTLQIGYTSISPIEYCDNSLADHKYNTTLYINLD